MEGDNPFAAPTGYQDEPAPTAYEQQPAISAAGAAPIDIVGPGGLSIEQAEKAQTIISIASVSAGEAVAALQAHGWSVEAAAGALLQGVDSRKRKQVTSFDPTPAVNSRAKAKKKPKLKLTTAAAAPAPKAKPAAKPRPAKKSPPTKASKDSGAAAGSAADEVDDGSKEVLDDKSGIVGELKVPLARVRRSKYTSNPPLPVSGIF